MAKFQPPVIASLPYPDRKNGGEFVILHDATNAWIGDVRYEYADSIVAALNRSSDISQKQPWNWETCSHRFVPWFGPVLKCRLCGATTMVSMDSKESKPIFAPDSYAESSNVATPAAIVGTSVDEDSGVAGRRDGHCADINGRSRNG